MIRLVEVKKRARSDSARGGECPGLQQNLSVPFPLIRKPQADSSIPLAGSRRAVAEGGTCDSTYATSHPPQHPAPFELDAD